MKEKHVKMKKSYNDKIFDIINVLLMCILVVIFVWPLWFIVIASFSDPNEVWLGHVLLLPKGFTPRCCAAPACARNSKTSIAS